METMLLENRRAARSRSLPEREVWLFHGMPAVEAPPPRPRTPRIRSLRAEDREAIIAFAEALPEDDLLFLERDITRPTEVDAWIKDALEGRLVTLLAWDDGAVAGYVTFNRGSVPWIRHVAELRVVVAESARGFGIGRHLLEMAFEMLLDLDVTKIIARMTREQTAALELFQRLGFAQEAVLWDHAMDARGHTHDLLVLSFHTPAHQEQCCEFCGIPVLDALVLDGSRLCSNCYDSRYNELGGG